MDIDAEGVGWPQEIQREEKKKALNLVKSVSCILVVKKTRHKASWCLECDASWLKFDKSCSGGVCLVIFKFAEFSQVIISRFYLNRNVRSNNEIFISVIPILRNFCVSSCTSVFCWFELEKIDLKLIQTKKIFLTNVSAVKRQKIKKYGNSTKILSIKGRYLEKCFFYQWSPLFLNLFFEWSLKTYWAHLVLALLIKGGPKNSPYLVNTNILLNDINNDQRFKIV